MGNESLLKDAPELLSPLEVAKHLRTSVKTVYNLVSRDALAGIYLDTIPGLTGRLVKPEKEGDRDAATGGCTGFADC